MRSAAVGGKIGSESPKSTSVGFSHRLIASRTCRIAGALGCSGSAGTSSGNATTPAFEAASG